MQTVHTPSHQPVHHSFKCSLKFPTFRRTFWLQLFYMRKVLYTRKKAVFKITVNKQQWIKIRALTRTQAMGYHLHIMWKKCCCQKICLDFTMLHWTQFFRLVLLGLKRWYSKYLYDHLIKHNVGQEPHEDFSLERDPKQLKFLERRKGMCRCTCACVCVIVG